MPDVEALAIAGIAWAALSVLAVALCVAAARGDRALMEEMEDSPAPARRRTGARTAQPPPATPRIVADTGRMRAQLRAAASLLDAAQVTLTVQIAGDDIVLATTRSVALVHPGDAPSIVAPILRDDRVVAQLRAVRRADAVAFDDGDRRLLGAVAARLGKGLQIDGGPQAVPLRRSRAMA